MNNQNSARTAILKEMQYRDIKVLHLEPTNVCQAKCPQCARETVGSFDSSKNVNISLDYIVDTLPLEFIQGLDKVFMCGSYGDPAANKEVYDIYKYFREVNPSIELGMNTNGGIRDASWWSELGKLFSQGKNYVVFSIDGLKDTNHLYRVNVNFDKVIENARAFIDSGGNALWEMLIFKHNEHQVEECRQLSVEMGFSQFNKKVTRRIMKDGLQLPTKYAAPTPIQNPTKISCHVLNEQSLYMAFTGKIQPCCWIGTHYYDDNVCMDTIDVTWDTSTPHPICVKTCGVYGSCQSVFKQQWLER